MIELRRSKSDLVKGGTEDSREFVELQRLAIRLGTGFKMNTFAIEVESLKCGGCATTITISLSYLAGVTGVTVAPGIKTVTFAGDESTRDDLVAKLKSLGYPEKGTAHGLEAGVATAKSYLSCAVGCFG